MTALATLLANAETAGVVSWPNLDLLLDAMVDRLDGMAVNLAEYGVVDGWSGDLAAAISSAKADGYTRGVIQAGTFTLTSVGTFSGFELVGDGMGRTIIDITGVTGDAITLGAEATIRDLTIQGPLSESDILSPASAWFTTIDDVATFNGIGATNAIYRTGLKSRVIDVEFDGVNGWCVKNGPSNTSALLGTGSGAWRCRFNHSYGGIYCPAYPATGFSASTGAEYLTFVANTAMECVIGACNQGGNNVFVGNRLDHCEVNFFLLAGHNDAHSNVIGGSLNHGRKASMLAYKVGNGMIFSGVSMHDGGDWGVYLNRSRGIDIGSCQLGSMNVHARGSYVGNAVDASPTGPGVNRIHHSLFKLHGVTYTITRDIDTGTTDADTLAVTDDNLLLHDNMHIEGSLFEDSSTTWNEDIVNDAEIDRLGWSHTDRNSINAVRGRPVDGWEVLGAGVQTGAIRIKMPHNFGAVINMHVKVTSWGAGRETVDYTITAYAVAGGTWTVPLAAKRGEDHAIRFGKDTADGKPLIYIGELASSWRDPLVEIVEYSAHAGSSAVTANKKFFKTGWGLSLEASAFDTVTHTIEGRQYTGDLNALAMNSEHYVTTGATNKPGALAGVVKTMVQTKDGNTRFQHFTDTSGGFWVRATTTGSAGWSAWAAK